MKVEWHDRLSTGFEIVDDQHKELFTHINDFFDSLSQEENYDNTIKTLNFLVKYVKLHFTTEEDLMKKYNYDEYKEHLTAHREIVEEIMECYKTLISSGKSPAVISKLRVILQKWFVSHIMQYDMKLAGFLRDFKD
jgi:hemerythrin